MWRTCGGEIWGREAKGGEVGEEERSGGETYMREAAKRSGGKAVERSREAERERPGIGLCK